MIHVFRGVGEIHLLRQGLRLLRGSLRVEDIQQSELDVVDVAIPVFMGGDLPIGRAVIYPSAVGKSIYFSHRDFFTKFLPSDPES